MCLQVSYIQVYTFPHTLLTRHTHTHTFTYLLRLSTFQFPSNKEILLNNHSLLFLFIQFQFCTFILSLQVHSHPPPYPPPPSERGNHTRRLWEKCSIPLINSGFDCLVDGDCPHVKNKKTWGWRGRYPVSCCNIPKAYCTFPWDFNPTKVILVKL